MNTATTVSSPARSTAAHGPSFIFHASFEELDAEERYGSVPEAADDMAGGFMADDVTRAYTRCMHFAAWRASAAKSARGAARWHRWYFDCRDRIVLGNRKLTFRAVHKWGPPPQLADDMTSECQIVLIKVVAAFNPWLGVRFSTYAFTCLMRALSRLSQRHAVDRLAGSLSLESLPYGEPACAVDEEPAGAGIARLYEYLHKDNTLLTPREKLVLARRYHLNDDAPATESLEQVGRELGLSKERVRQVQLSALGKLRAAIGPEVPKV